MDPTKQFIENISQRDDELNQLDFNLINSSMGDFEANNLVFDELNTSEIKVMTNFSKDSVLELFANVDAEIAASKPVKGPKCKLTDLDIFLLLLTYLKTYPSYSTIAKPFKITATTAQKVLERTICAVTHKLMDTFVKFIKREEQCRLGITCADYKDVALILDCTVQEIPRYSGSFSDAKKFYSQKHGIYCAKKEIGHLPNGLVCFVGLWQYGSKHDFSLFKENLPIYREYLKKEENREEFWKVMVDKGYDGIDRYLPSVMPKKGRDLNANERYENKRIGSCRVICENYYGRLKSLWGATRNKVRNDMKNYDNIFGICVALTNYHLLSNPLRRTDLVRYRSFYGRTVESNISIVTNSSTDATVAEQN